MKMKKTIHSYFNRKQFSPQIERVAPMKKKAEMPKFTIIELLIVISIIAILAAMLLPALNKARVRATSTSCLSNQKQLGLQFAMYADSYKGLYPLEMADHSWLPTLLGLTSLEYEKKIRNLNTNPARPSLTT